MSAEPSAEDRRARMARRGSSMLTALTMSAVRLTDMAGRAKKVVEEKRRRAEFALIASTSEKWNWITDDKEGFIPAKVLKENPDGSMEVEYGVSRSVKVVKKNEQGPPIVRVAEIKNHFDDMVRMGDVNEATILHNLRMRFAEDIIYTNIGSILVSINPFKFFPALYTPELIETHLNLPPGEISKPHVFQIAAAAFHGLRGERTNQSIVISGESGAGKTEATKKCLQFFASAAGSAAEGIQDRLLSANPILEGFGNAKTVRNNNSSRFGKWMEVHFNSRAQICGCSIINYLLEKSRVVFQAQQERNYHIFYMLSAAAPSELRTRLALSGPENYAFTSKSNCIVVDNMSDHELFEELSEAFDSVGFKKQEVDDLYTIIAGLLHLSNVTFAPVNGDKDVAEVDKNATVRAELGHAARLLGADPDTLKKCLEQKLIEARGERVWSPLSVDKSFDARNSMAKAIYGRMFDWLVQRVNESMRGSIGTSANIIGVLDIFGFEIFDNNSFEQLCINYCNEKLQQHFNYHVFKAEEKCYKSEEIDYAEVRFIDNQDVLDLIEQRPNGLLPKLDDECRVPRGADTGFVEKVTKMYAENPRFKSRPKVTVRTIDGTVVPQEYLFGVNHYAGLVVYNSGGFMEKNKDELLLNVREILQDSKTPFINSLFNTPAADGPSGMQSPGGGAKDKVSQSQQFRQQLASLMDTLNATEPHYIRCIKPNGAKKPQFLEAPVCLQQLRYAGVFEAVKIRQQGFPFRWVHEVFFKRYRCCAAAKDLRGRLNPGGQDWKEACRRLIADLVVAAPQLEGTLKFGRTMILYRADPHRILEMMRDYARENSAVAIQRVWLGFKARKIARKMKAARDRIRGAIRSRALDLVTAAMQEGSKLPFRLFEMKELDALHTRLLEEKRIIDALSVLITQDPVEKYQEYEAVLKDAARLEITGEIVATAQHKFNTVRDRIETKTNLLKGIAMGDKALILRSLAKAEELRPEWGEIVPPDAVEKAKAMLEVIAKEEATLDGLRGALSSGAPKGTVGTLDVSTVDYSSLDRAIASALSGAVRISTAVGQNLILTAQRVRDLRQAFRGGEWQAIESTVAAAVALRGAGQLAVEAESEVKMAEAEVADRRIIRAVNAALASGAAKGRVGELSMQSADVPGLASAIKTAEEMGKLVGSVSSPAANLIASAKLVLKLRQAMVSNDWGSIKKVVAEALDTRLPEACLGEVQAAKDELDNHNMIHQLSDALEKGYALGTVAKLDLTMLDVTALTDRIAYAEDLGPKTPKAQALLKLSKVIRKVRLALQSGDYTSLPELCKQGATVPREFFPAITVDELTLAQYEGENTIIIRALRDAISTGGARGHVGAVNRSTINTTLLAAGLKKATLLKCRSEEALWLQETAEALLDMRTAFRDNQWSALQEHVLAVRAMDRTRPTKTVSPVDAPPVLKDIRGTRAAAMSRMATMADLNLNASKGGDGGSGSGIGAARGGVPSLMRAPTASRMSIIPTAMIAAAAAAAAASEASSNDDGNGSGEGASRGSSSYTLPPALSDELRLTQDELDNHNMIVELTSALRVGGPQGNIGELDSNAVRVDELDLGLKRNDRPGAAKTPQAASLIYTARVVKTLRLALKAPDWPQVEATLATIAANNARIVRFAAATNPELAAVAPATAIPTSALGKIEVPAFAEDPEVLEQAHSTLNEAGMAEVVRVELEVEYRKVIITMTSALESGGPVLTSAGLDVAPITVSELAKAIDASRALGARTEKSKHLTTLCRLMWQMRTAALEDDWPSVESLLAASSDVVGKTAPLPPNCVVPAALKSELELYRLEANNRRMVAALSGALKEGAAIGDIGRLDIGAIDTKRLEESIRLTLQLGPETAEAKCLAATALHIRSLRLALMGGQWERMGELLDYLHAAVDKTNPFGFTPSSREAAAVAAATLAAQQAGVSGASPASRIAGSASMAGASTAFSPQVYSNTKDGIGVMGSWPGVVDLQQGWDIAVHGVSGLAAPEVDVMQLELNNRNIIVQLTAAIAKGAATGSTGHLDLSTVETGALEWAVDFAQRIGCVTEDAKQMLATAQVVKKIRLALLGGDWSRLEAALAEAHGKVLADIGAAEIHAAQDELNNRAILSELAAALARGRPQGRTGRLYTGSIDVKPLNEAISLATKLGPKTLEARQMLFTAKVVARLRLCLMNEDLPEAGLTLEAVRGKMLASVAMPEIRLVQDEVDNWTVVSDLTTAITNGGPSGVTGSLDLSTVDTAVLEKAIEKAEELGIKTSEATSLLAASKLLYRLRTALARDNWAAEDSEGVESILRDAAAVPISELARGELDLVQSEVENRRMIQSLSKALASGSARGPVGELDLSAVDTAMLDSAIAEATELGPKTPDAERPLQAAKIIRRLRSVMLAGNWQWVGSVLLEARSVKHIFPPIALKELQLAQDELDNRAIVAQITAALRTGGISGAVGHLDVDAISVTPLEEALSYAKTLGVKSADASQMVSTAQVIKRLRTALKTGSFAEAQEILESLKGKVLASIAADEIQLARLNVDNWLVTSELTSAIVTGAAAGVLGEIDTASIAVDALDVAIALAMKLGCHTVEARRCLVTALIVRRLRAALLDGDDTFLAQVLAEADRESDALLSSAKVEVQAARDLLAFKESMNALSSALKGQDESALVDALAKAARLNLSEHPKAHVREMVEAATLALGRIQRCKAALASGIKTLEANTLLDALAMAASLGYSHPLVDEAKRVLASVQALTERANTALRNMAAPDMQTVLKDCDAVGLNIGVLIDIRRTLSLPRAEFLRRELAAVLAQAAAAENSPLHAPLGDNPRSPSALEQRIVHCTLQLKDLFFADQPEADEAALLGSPSPASNVITTSVAGHPAIARTNSSTPGSPASGSYGGVSSLNSKAARHVDENVRGATMRNQPLPLLGGYSWALGGGLAAGSVFKPGGAATSVGGSSSGASAAAISAGNIGGVIPPPHSRLRRQFELARIPRLKPAHMFSRKYGVSETADSGMLRWQHEPLHTSLLLHNDAEVRRLAVKAFRDILAFMGDRPLSRPIGLAAELLELAQATPELRDEVFLQLCKQLTGNPSVASLERGWVLMHLALASFPPSEEMENHLELFLRERGAIPCVWALHLTLYRGGPGQRGAPSAAEIKTALEAARAPALPVLAIDFNNGSGGQREELDALEAYASNALSGANSRAILGASSGGLGGAGGDRLRAASPPPPPMPPMAVGGGARSSGSASAAAASSLAGFLNSPISAAYPGAGAGAMTMATPPPVPQSSNRFYDPRFAATPGLKTAGSAVDVAIEERLASIANTLAQTQY